VRTVLPPTLNSWLVSGITIGVGAVVYVATMCLAFRGHVRMALEIARTLRDGRPESPVAPLEGAASP
jgi:hypothetical protein